ncbi:MAG: ATP phosphoribosyltransferase regulatory subunit [Phyllobacteriaceae bacterium]|nr:ATP phosphoribosyltransferase regulatory subunit [Phyllobacteriaceae bacterium]
MTARAPRIAAEVAAQLAARHAVRAEVAVLQPADPFLDMAGEDMRRRMFLTESETGQTLCLRPEFTIPVCRDHIVAGARKARRWYLGEVFRQRRDGAAEFHQAGLEDLGDPDEAAADARVLADAHAVASLARRDLTVTLGDQGVFEAVLIALGLPEGWRRRLARAFGDSGQLDLALADLGRPKGAAHDGEVAALIAAGDATGLAAHIVGEMAAAGLSATAGRAPEEIARRALEKAALATVRLEKKALAALTEFLAIRSGLDKAPAALSAFAIRSGLALDAALARFGARVAAIAAEGLDPAALAYDAAFGRPLDYYTGLVFEISAPGLDKPLAGGGRYDRLLTLLGAPSPIAGVGFSVWLDRLDKAAGGAS